MHPVILRKTACAGAVVLPLLFVSCHRQSVEPKQPVVEQQKGSQAANPAVPMGTSGTDTVPGEPAAAGVGTSAAPREPTATASDAVIERDPEAIKALEAMANYLRTLKAFQVRSETSREEVLDSGLNVDFGGTVDMIVYRPNRLRAELTSDKQHRMYFDDGKTFSVWARKVNYYARSRRRRRSENSRISSPTSTISNSRWPTSSTGVSARARRHCGRDRHRDSQVRRGHL